MSYSNKKKAGQKHQNKFAFQLKTSANSKLTKKIKATPLDFLCQRCFDQLSWKITYKKYKPLSTPKVCVDCKMKIITKAYRALCDGCSNKKIEIRVPNEEATTLGLVKDPYENNKQCLSMGCSLPKENQIQDGKEEETKEVAE